MNDNHLNEVCLHGGKPMLIVSTGRKEKTIQKRSGLRQMTA